MNLYGYEFQRESDLMHYGVMGMRWGVRRYQDRNGGLTSRGRRRYHINSSNLSKQIRGLNKLSKDISTAQYKKELMDYKRDNALSKGNIKKGTKFNKKSESLAKSISLGRKEVERCISNISKSGVKVGSVQRKRYVNTGKAIALHLLTPAASAVRIGVDAYRGVKTGDRHLSGIMDYNKYVYDPETLKKKK